MRPQYYVSECPDTHRQFLVEQGQDNNIAELSIENVRQIRDLFRPITKTSGPARRQDDLFAFLVEQAKHYKAEILPLYPADDEHFDTTYDFLTYDEAKTDFLDSLWDVILQHLTDNGDIDNGD